MQELVKIIKRWRCNKHKISGIRVKDSDESVHTYVQKLHLCARLREP